MMILIDNYDSFTFNLYQYLGEINPNIKVFRNDKITLDEIEKINPDHIILSPGPGRPENAGICVELVKRFSGRIPILGICLGHQAISLAFGSEIIYAPEIVHGKISKILNYQEGILKSLPKEFDAGRYHSLCVSAEQLADCLEIQAITVDKLIMAIKHKQHPTYGLQFHPESILTKHGKQILQSFLKVEK